MFLSHPDTEIRWFLFIYEVSSLRKQEMGWAKKKQKRNQSMEMTEPKTRQKRVFIKALPEPLFRGRKP